MMRPTLTLGTLGLLLLAAPAGAANPQPRIEIVIALDTSGSMRGLIDATRHKLWEVVRTLGQAKPLPRLRVGLIAYGGKDFDPAAGWVRREVDLTTNLDEVSARLFALRARGSQEYVARAVQTAVRSMSWDQDPSTLKIVFVAGNESAEQDPHVSLTAALGEARQRKILVNSIYCGRPDARDATGWRRVAALGAGEFNAIDHNRSAVARATPYDVELARLSRDLSGTYVGYGASGAHAKARQAEEDARAERESTAVAADRAAAKAAATYANDDWDAVDAYARGRKDIALPPEIARLPWAAREGWLRARLVERERLRRRIDDVAQKRAQFLAADRAPAATAASAAAPPAPVVAVTESPAPKPAPARRPTVTSPAPRASMDEALPGAVRRIAAENGYSF